MREGWRVVALGDVAEIFDGPHATPKKTDHGPVFLGVSNLSDGRLDLSNTDHLSEVDYKKWTKRVIPATGDIVFAYETRLGEAALIPEGLRCCLGRRMGLLRLDRKYVDPDYMLYAYLGPEFQEEGVKVATLSPCATWFAFCYAKKPSLPLL
jgi:type I restriction enzyme, S subunit